jgi:hypothetical protein
MRCNFWYQRRALRNQMEWMGAALLPTWVFVCSTCYDFPNEQNRARIYPADPIPIQLALPENFDGASADYMGLTAGSTIDPITGIPVPGKTAMSTTSGVVMGPAPVGRPPGYYALAAEPPTPRAVLMAQVGGVYMALSDGTAMGQVGPDGATSGTVQPFPEPDGEAPLSGIPIPVVSLIADGTPLVRATCNGPHGLALNSQIAVRGTANPLADGMFSVIPITATAFTYGTFSPIPAGSILGPNMMIIATQAGLPRSYEALPQTGLPQNWPRE